MGARASWKQGDLMAILIYKGEVMGKPRQTRSDKWKTRACVLRYRSMADEIRLAAGRVTKFTKAPERLRITAYLPIPASWSKKKKAEHSGKLHTSKPDIDNIAKAVMDALFEDDSGVAELVAKKRWDDGNGARIEIDFTD
jgi:Holliday junction resolvase RusA-like endonuclease